MNKLINDTPGRSEVSISRPQFLRNTGLLGFLGFFSVSNEKVPFKVYMEIHLWKMKLSWGVWTVVFWICLQISCALSAIYICCWAVNNLLTQAQGAQYHSVSPIWEPLEWNVEHNVGFQHLPTYLWTLLACLDSSLSFLIISVLSPCKNNTLIEVLQRVLGINFWTPRCRRVMFIEQPSSCLKCLTCNPAFIWS